MDINNKMSAASQVIYGNKLLFFLKLNISLSFVREARQIDGVKMNYEVSEGKLFL